jgi:pyruvate-formate lyase-activating enzyme
VHGAWVLRRVHIDYAANARGVLVELTRGVGAHLGLQLLVRLPGMTGRYLTRYFALRQVTGTCSPRTTHTLLETLRETVRRNETEGRFSARDFARFPRPPFRHADVLTTGRCNQHCIFCSLSPQALQVQDDPEAVHTHLIRARTHGARFLMFAGRECTLERELPGYVRFAKDLGFEEVRLVTNGTLLADRDRVEELKAAGIDHILVSLHGDTAARADAITGVVGDFARTCAALDVISAAGITVKLSFVVCRQNKHDVRRFVEFVAERFGAGVAEIVLSFVAPLHNALQNAAAVIPRLTDVLPELGAAIEAARERGLQITIPDLCGLPPCLLPEHLWVFEELRNLGPSGTTDQKVHLPSCRSCAVRHACSGIWTPYLEIFGDGEFDGRRLRVEQLWPPLDPPGTGCGPGR